jgi:2-oxoglutarate ferredoxin oxidoreductase subunit alpha
VFVLSDLDLGMNQWMTEPFEYPTEPMDRGKVLTAEDVERLGGFSRYKDVDGDGIGWRTLPGTDHPLAAYFTRGSGHNERAQYSERPDDWERNMARLTRKFETARTLVPAPILSSQPGAKVGLIAFGSTDPAVIEARARLSEAGLATDYLRLRALPLRAEVADFVAAHDVTYVIEMNTDAQMHQLVQLHVPEQATRVRQANKSDGLPLTAGWITEFLTSALAKEN